MLFLIRPGPPLAYLRSGGARLPRSKVLRTKEGALFAHVAFSRRRAPVTSCSSISRGESPKRGRACADRRPCRKDARPDGELSGGASRARQAVFHRPYVRYLEEKRYPEEKLKDFRAWATRSGNGRGICPAVSATGICTGDVLRAQAGDTCLWTLTRPAALSRCTMS
jgi:hypothetical protein